MKKYLLKITILLLFISAGSLKSQVFKNNGATITIRPGSKVVVNGNAQNAKGNIRIQSNGELRVLGDFTVTSDSVQFENSSLGIVTGNMVLGPAGVFYRNTGYLTVFGAIFNSGKLYNLGGIIEIGLP